MAKSMIFFSMHYPFHFTDSYLDEEINYLASQFDQLIIVSSNTHSKSQREIPKNAVLLRFNPFNEVSKMASFTSIFSPFFWKEISLLKKKYHLKLNTSLLKELVLNLNRIKCIEKYIDKIWVDYQLEKNEVLIYTYWFLEAASATAFYKNKSHKKFNFISKAHSQEIYFFRNYYNYQPYKFQTFEACDKMFFISEDGLKYFAEAHKLSHEQKKKLEINRIGVVGIDSFIPSRNDNVLKLVSIAWLHKLKRIELIVDALAQLPHINIEWIHLGSSIDEPYTNKLNLHIENKIGKSTNIKYTFCGETNKREMKEIFEKNKFDFLINVSETEGIPVSMMEAASFSVPLFGTNVGGVSEIIEHHKNGYLFSPNPSAEEIAQTIEKFYSLSLDEKNQYRNNAFLTWKHKYNVFENRQKLLESINLLM
jgi:colanic acid/amylovoran biosynthesis glycosyltransferase